MNAYIRRPDGSFSELTVLKQEPHKPVQLEFPPPERPKWHQNMSRLQANTVRLIITLIIIFMAVGIGNAILKRP